MGFFQFEAIINVLVSSFWFTRIHVLWIYGHYKYFYFYSTRIAYSRRNLRPQQINFMDDGFAASILPW